MIPEDGMILYHGSYVEIDRIDLSLCDTAKDFGRGFYLTSSENQATSFIRTSLAKARRKGLVSEEQNYGYVTSFRLRFKPDVSCYEFSTTSRDWLYYIAINRRKNLSNMLLNMLTEDFDKYEVLLGRIANDDTNATLNAFLAGTYGDINSKQTYEIVSQLLKPERLENQFCFKSDKAIGMLEKIGSERHEIR